MKAGKRCDIPSPAVAGRAWGGMAAGAAWPVAAPAWALAALLASAAVSAAGIDPLTGAVIEPAPSTAAAPAAAPATAPIAATGPAPALAAPLRGHGQQTRGWVAMQRSGEAAYGPVQGMPGEVAEQVWARYVESFSHPIPERFERERIGGQGR